MQYRKYLQAIDTDEIVDRMSKSYGQQPVDFSLPKLPSNEPETFGQKTKRLGQAAFVHGVASPAAGLLDLPGALGLPGTTEKGYWTNSLYDWADENLDLKGTTGEAIAGMGGALLGYALPWGAVSKTLGATGQALSRVNYLKPTVETLQRLPKAAQVGLREAAVGAGVYGLVEAPKPEEHRPGFLPYVGLAGAGGAGFHMLGKLLSRAGKGTSEGPVGTGGQTTTVSPAANELERRLAGLTVGEASKVPPVADGAPPVQAQPKVTVAPAETGPMRTTSGAELLQQLRQRKAAQAAEAGEAVPQVADARPYMFSGKHMDTDTATIQDVESRLNAVIKYWENQAAGYQRTDINVDLKDSGKMNAHEVNVKRAMKNANVAAALLRQLKDNQMTDEAWTAVQKLWNPRTKTKAGREQMEQLGWVDPSKKQQPSVPAAAGAPEPITQAPVPETVPQTQTPVYNQTKNPLERQPAIPPEFIDNPEFVLYYATQVAEGASRDVALDRALNHFAKQVPTVKTVEPAPTPAKVSEPTPTQPAKDDLLDRVVNAFKTQGEKTINQVREEFGVGKKKAAKIRSDALKLLAKEDPQGWTVHGRVKPPAPEPAPAPPKATITRKDVVEMAKSGVSREQIKQLVYADQVLTGAPHEVALARAVNASNSVGDRFKFGAKYQKKTKPVTKTEPAKEVPTVKPKRLTKQEKTLAKIQQVEGYSQVKQDDVKDLVQNLVYGAKEDAAVYQRLAAAGDSADVGELKKYSSRILNALEDAKKLREAGAPFKGKIPNALKLLEEPKPVKEPKPAKPKVEDTPRVTRAQQVKQEIASYLKQGKEDKSFGKFLRTDGKYVGLLDDTKKARESWLNAQEALQKAQKAGNVTDEATEFANATRVLNAENTKLLTRLKQLDKEYAKIKAEAAAKVTKSNETPDSVPVNKAKSEVDAATKKQMEKAYSEDLKNPEKGKAEAQKIFWAKVADNIKTETGSDTVTMGYLTKRASEYKIPLSDYVKYLPEHGINISKPVIKETPKTTPVDKPAEKIAQLHGFVRNNPSDNNNPKLTKFKYHEDRGNPAWLKETQEKAVKEIDKLKKDPKDVKLGDEATFFGKTTASFHAPVYLSPKWLKQNIAGGFRNEQKGYGTQKAFNRIEAIKKSIQEKGYDNREIPLIHVDAKGRAFFIEGNHRVMAADAAGVSRIPVEIKYYDGAEQVAGAFKPDNIVTVGKLNPEKQSFARPAEPPPGEKPLPKSREVKVIDDMGIGKGDVVSVEQVNQLRDIAKKRKYSYKKMVEEIKSRGATFSQAADVQTNINFGIPPYYAEKLAKMFNPARWFKKDSKVKPAFTEMHLITSANGSLPQSMYGLLPQHLLRGEKTQWGQIKKDSYRGILDIDEAAALVNHRMHKLSILEGHRPLSEWSAESLKKYEKLAARMNKLQKERDIITEPILFELGLAKKRDFDNMLGKKLDDDQMFEYAVPILDEQGNVVTRMYTIQADKAFKADVIAMPNSPRMTDYHTDMLKRPPTWYAQVLGSMRDVLGEPIATPLRNSYKAMNVFEKQFEKRLFNIIKDVRKNNASLERITYLMEGNDVKGASSGEKRIAKELREWYNDLFAHFGIDGNKFIDNYVPHIRAQDSVMKAYPQGKVPKEIMFFAEMDRKGKVTAFPMETNALASALVYLRHGSRKKFLDPVLQQIKPYEKMMNADRKRLYENIVNNIMHRPVWEERLVNSTLVEISRALGKELGPQKGNAAKDLTAFMSQLTYLSTIWVNPMTALKNLTQMTLAVAGLGNNPAVGLKYFGKALAYMRTAKGREALKYCWVYQHRAYREGMEQQDKLLRKFLPKKVEEAGYWMFSTTDKANVSVSYMMQLLKALDEGKSTAEAVRRANNFAANTQFLYGLDSPMLWKSSVGRLMGVLLSWPINFFRLMHQYALTPGDRTKIFTTFAATAGTMYGLNKVTGLDFSQEAPLGIASGFMPISMLLSGGSGSIPVEALKANAQVLEKFYSGNPKELEQAIDEWQRSHSAFIPAATQGKRVAKFVNAAMNDWEVKDSEGKLVYRMETPSERARTLIGPTTESRDRWQEHKKIQKDKDIYSNLRKQAIQAYMEGDTKKLMTLQRKLIESGGTPIGKKDIKQAMEYRDMTALERHERGLPSTYKKEEPHAGTKLLKELLGGRY